MARVWVPSGGSGEQSRLLSTTALFSNLTQREDPPACPIRSCKRASLPEHPRALIVERASLRAKTQKSQKTLSMSHCCTVARPGGVEAS